MFWGELGELKWQKEGGGMSTRVLLDLINGHSCNLAFFFHLSLSTIQFVLCYLGYPVLEICCINASDVVGRSL